MRKTIYFRNEDRWILSAIKAMLKEADEIGVRCSESDVVVSALKEYLSRYKNTSNISRKYPVVTELKKTVMCPKSKDWVFERVEDLVRLKQAVGIHTSFSYELVQLAASALTGSIEYGKIQANMLKNFKDL